MYISCFGWNYGLFLSSHNFQITRITGFYLFMSFFHLKDWHNRNFSGTYLSSTLNIQNSFFIAVTWRPHLRVCENISEISCITFPYASLPIRLPSMNFIYHFIDQTVKVWYSSTLWLRSACSIWIAVAPPALHSQPFFCCLK